MSPRQGSPVPRELLPPYIKRCQSLATSIFQPPPSGRTTTSSQHARPSGVLRHRSDGLECAAWRPPRPDAQCRQFPEEAKDASVSECTWTLTALEALRNALYKFKTYLLTYLLPLYVSTHTCNDRPMLHQGKPTDVQRNAFPDLQNIKFNDYKWAVQVIHKLLTKRVVKEQTRNLHLDIFWKYFSTSFQSGSPWNRGWKSFKNTTCTLF